MLSANLALSAVNGYTLTRGSGSAWAAPLGMISGVASLLYESGVNEGNGFVVATGFVSVAFGIASLVKAEGKSKGRPAEEARWQIRPVSRPGAEGRWYAGLVAGVKF
jgi:hypothetical protein